MHESIYYDTHSLSFRFIAVVEGKTYLHGFVKRRSGLHIGFIYVE